MSHKKFRDKEAQKPGNRKVETTSQRSCFPVQHPATDYRGTLTSPFPPWHSCRQLYNGRMGELLQAPKLGFLSSPISWKFRFLSSPISLSLEQEGNPECPNSQFLKACLCTALSCQRQLSTQEQRTFALEAWTHPPP